MKKDNSKNKIKCNYCSIKNEEQDVFLGTESSICIDCITTLNAYINSSQKTQSYTVDKKPELIDLLVNFKPVKIIDHLNKYIIEQNEAKEVMSVSFYNHYKRLILKDPDIQKSNILLMGPSGSGKTLISQKISNLLDLPFVSVDATKFTEAGYIGSDVEDILTELYIKSGEDLEKTEYGIVHIDEWDKISEPSKGSHHVNKRGVQQSFLKMIEGGDFFVSTTINKKDIDSDKIKINTKNILFICSGAFEGIYDVVKKRMNVNSGMGFSSQLKEDISDYSFIDQVEDVDLINYGMMKEIVARLSFKTFVRELSESDLKKIITEPKDSIINGYKKLLKLDGINLEFDDSAVSEIASIAFKQKTGARALKSIMDKRLKDVMIEASKGSNKKVVMIDKDYVLGNKNAKDLFVKK